MNPFRVGDKVIVIKERAAYSTGEGTTGIITEVYINEDYPNSIEYEIKCILYKGKRDKYFTKPDEYYIYQPHDCLELYDVIIPKQQQVINKIREMYERRSLL